MAQVMRIIIGVVGLQFIALGLWFWVAPEVAANPFGLIAAGPAGIATLRADVGTLFLAMGGFAAVAALRQDPRLLMPVVVILLLAMAGRALTLVTFGLGLTLIAPLVIEAVLLALVLGAMRTLKGQGHARR